jgi:hypothetical protein
MGTLMGMPMERKSALVAPPLSQERFRVRSIVFAGSPPAQRANQAADSKRVGVVTSEVDKSFCKRSLRYDSLRSARAA